MNGQWYVLSGVPVGDEWYVCILFMLWLRPPLPAFLAFLPAAAAAGHEGAHAHGHEKESCACAQAEADLAIREALDEVAARWQEAYEATLYADEGGAPGEIGRPPAARSPRTCFYCLSNTRSRIRCLTSAARARGGGGRARSPSISLRAWPGWRCCPS